MDIKYKVPQIYVLTVVNNINLKAYTFDMNITECGTPCYSFVIDSAIINCSYAA